VADKQYKMGRTGLLGKGKETSVKGSDKIKAYEGKKNLPPNIMKYLSKVGNVLKIAAKAPKISVPSILIGVGSAYLGNKITKYVDERTGKKGNIAKKYLGADAPKDTGPKALRAKSNPDSKVYNRKVSRSAGQVVPQGKAYGGKAMKTYAMGGGIRKAKTYG
tara:strand:+ start:65 stop:550 length:486 start_codon:yes stop_codon:yes gene_type:complete